MTRASCCTRQQTDVCDCVWSLYQSSDACHVTSDPWRSVRDVPEVRGHLSFLNTETALDQARFRARAGVPLIFITHSSFSFSHCLQRSVSVSPFSSPVSQAQAQIPLLHLWLIKFLPCFCPIFFLHVSIISTNCHPFTHLQWQNCMKFIMRKSRCS